MRDRGTALAVPAIAIVFAVIVYVAVARPESAAYPTPTPTATSSPNPSSSAVASTATPTSAPSPTPSATSSALGAVTMQVTRTTVPAEFRYLMLGSGEEFRLVVLDLNAGRATQVATARIASIPGVATEPSAAVATSADGRIVLVTFDVPDANDSLFVVRPESGEAKLLLRGEIAAAVISRDGARIALGRIDGDPALTGLWTGTLDGAMRRLVADNPASNGSPPLPYAFSPDGGLLAFGVGLGDGGRQGVLISASSKEGRVDRAGGDPQVVGADTSVIGPALGAEFRSARELFVWSSRSMFGGATVAYGYDVSAQRQTDLYRPTGDILITAAAWRPNSEQYATIERPSCCGVFAAGTAAWLRGRDGSARKLADAAFVSDMWWSRDGSRVFAVVGGDDSVGGITDLLSGKGVMQFCRRGGGPPPAPCT